MEILKIENITKKYSDRTILDNVSFSACKGTCIAVAGANGCGKSTLLGIIAGARKPSSGDIYIDGKCITHSGHDFAQNIGYVPQENPLFTGLSVYDNLRFWYCDTGRNLKEDFKNGLAAALGLTPYKNYTVEKLSGGMKKRLSIACALAKNPPIIILDEPTASLDIICKEDIKNYLLEFKKNGGTIIITSHEDSDLSIADTMYIIKNGSLIHLEHPIMGRELSERLKND